MASHTLDTKGMNCPLPILKTKKAIEMIQAGEDIEVLATDPAAVQDFEAFSRSTGHELVEWGETDGVFRFLLKKG
ncbi:MAG: sulfurtransferase TusA family protein [Alphaproteobacteria bacterium]